MCRLAHLPMRAQETIHNTLYNTCIIHNTLYNTYIMQARPSSDASARDYTSREPVCNLFLFFKRDYTTTAQVCTFSKIVSTVAVNSKSTRTLGLRICARCSATKMQVNLWQKKEICVSTEHLQSCCSEHLRGCRCSAKTLVPLQKT
jgi:hypothetical protein